MQYTLSIWLIPWPLVADVGAVRSPGQTRDSPPATVTLSDTCHDCVCFSRIVLTPALQPL